MTTQHEVALKAIHNRDPEQLATAFPDVESASSFRDEVLPSLAVEEIRWFWSQTLSPDELRIVAKVVVDVVADVAAKEGFLLGTDYSVAVDDEGLTQLLATEAVTTRAMNRLPAERRSLFRALVKTLPA